MLFSCHCLTDPSGVCLYFYVEENVFEELGTPTVSEVLLWYFCALANGYDLIM